MTNGLPDNIILFALQSIGTVKKVGKKEFTKFFSDTTFIVSRFLYV